MNRRQDGNRNFIADLANAIHLDWRRPFRLQLARNLHEAVALEPGAYTQLGTVGIRYFGQE